MSLTSAATFDPTNEPTAKNWLQGPKGKKGFRKKKSRCAKVDLYEIYIQKTWKTHGQLGVLGFESGYSM